MTFARSHYRRGFTLTELLISVGLALLVLYGVNTVFKATADTIGTGQALGEANRTLRAIENNFTSDFNPQLAGTPATEVPGTGILPSLLPDPTYYHQQPAIAIRCERTLVFQNKADEASNGGNAPGLWDPTESGTPVAVPTTLINYRNHRIDTLSFFTAGKTGAVGTEVGSFRRQTGQILGGRETLVTDLAKPAEHAWVWYGHARLPVDPTSIDLTEANYVQPGVGNATSNPNNYYASDWVLARKATLILNRDLAGATVTNRPGGYVYTDTGEPMYFYRNSGTAGDLTPIAYGSQAAYATQATAATTVDTPAPATGGQDLIQASVYDVAAIVGGIGTRLPPPAVGDGGIYETFFATAPANWLLLAHTTTAVTSPAYRFNANPLVGPPLVSQVGQLPASFKTALASSQIARGCTQFIVEFACDVDGNNVPDTTPVSYDPDGAVGPLAPVIVQSIQWYGLPRDTGVGTAPVLAAAGPSLRAGGSPADTFATYVWGPAELTVQTTRPVLIRITVQLIDSNNRLQDGMTREFIYRVR